MPTLFLARIGKLRFEQIIILITINKLAKCSYRYYSNITFLPFQSKYIIGYAIGTHMLTAKLDMSYIFIHNSRHKFFEQKSCKKQKIRYFVSHKNLIRLYHPRTVSSRDVFTNYIIILKIATAIFSEKNCNKRASFLDFYVMHLSPLLLLICRVLFTNKKILSK